VLGPSYSGNAAWWKEWAAAAPGRDVLVSPRDYVTRCAAADLVICGAGTTTYELAFLGRPFVPVALVDNQARVSEEWCRQGVGPGLCVWQPDWPARLRREVEQLLENGAARAARSESVLRLVDGRGPERVLAACREAVRRGSEA
jgi:UDP-N-acetylglucosamine:LPS N-acetylglucosamine transferase